MSDLRHEIENLSASEKAELLDVVWESLELSLTDAQRAELDHRIERHEQNPSDVIPWEQVRASLFKKLCLGARAAQFQALQPGFSCRVPRKYTISASR